MRRPPWLSTRRILLVIGLAVSAAAAIALLHRKSERSFLEQFVASISVSAELSADALLGAPADADRPGRQQRTE